ncbi:unnamed protein product [Cyprideis torosa]|uniref:Uncharacterized protein n=1 Tax=Cyprideis torosa TaxID=163714 RepID=A0A7R8WAA3_9CRUS|nr:unnamed protein product [Cyprideis torosa]CAG0885102.1 unnamed protein product [Cyprideis torosa]
MCRSAPAQTRPAPLQIPAAHHHYLRTRTHPPQLLWQASQQPKEYRFQVARSIQNPFTWLANKYDLYQLQTHYDPEFDLKEFKYGAVLLMTRVLEYAFQKSKYTFTLEDFVLCYPYNVRLMYVGERMHCDVTLRMTAFKFSSPESLFINILATYSREYSKDEGPANSWEITNILVPQMILVPTKKKE